MNIKRMTATFGRLSGQTLTLAPGFNLVEAPNEGGKSTWAAFLKAMLYGIDTRDRDKKGYLADKNRYQPWSGAPMEGELVLEWQGRDITIRRSPRGNTPFGAFSAVYTGTEEPVPGLTAASCGELLTGVGREVFERSAFLGQSGSLAITAAPELERRIAALVSSGEEDVSYSQAEGRLKEWLNRRRVNKSVGRIPQLEGELSQVRASREELEQLTGALNALAAEERGLRRRKEALEEELAAHRQLAQLQLDRRFTRAAEELAQAREALDALRKEQSRFGSIPRREELKRAQGELAYLKALEPEIKNGEEALAQAEEALDQARAVARDDRFPGQTAEQAAEAVKRAEAGCAALEKKAAVWSLAAKLFPIAGAVLALGMIGFGLMEGRSILDASILVWFIVFAITCLFGAANYNMFKRWRAKEEQILARFGVTAPEELEGVLEDYRSRAAAADQAAQQVRLVREGLSDRQARRENSRRDLFDFVHSFAPEAKDLFGCSAALSRALSLEERETVARAKLEGAQNLYDALKAQGGREADPAAPVPAAPERPMEETAALLGAAQADLERTARALTVALGRQKAGGDPAALAARQEALEEALARRTQEHQAIAAALEGLKAANAQLQERFSPQLNRRAGEYLARLTGEKYTSLSLNRELEASAAGAGDVLPRRALFLSKGTVDQVYLAVRLAVYDLCLGERRVPLVLDDALAAFDDGRMANALDLLLERAREDQVLFFTCQRREGAYLAQKPGVTRAAVQSPSA